MTFQPRRIFVSVVTACLALAVTPSVALAADEAKVQEAISRVDSLTGLVGFAPCSRVKDEFQSRGGANVARTSGDLQARVGGEIAGQIRRLERSAGQLTPSQRARVEQSLNRGAQAAINRAVSCGIVSPGGPSEQPAPQPVQSPGPQTPPVRQQTARAETSQHRQSPETPQPVLAPTAPRPAVPKQQQPVRPTTIVIHNPFDQAHPIRLAVPVLPEGLALPALPAGSSYE